MSTAPLETTSSLQPLTSYLVTRSSPERFASLLRDLSPAAVSAGLTAFVFYTTSGVPLLLGITQRLGLDAAQTSSWFFIIFFSGEFFA